MYCRVEGFPCRKGRRSLRDVVSGFVVMKGRTAMLQLLF